jgi:tRNA pseudouridine32 synthase / 23S rRNA pseudouridine746 synthase
MARGLVTSNEGVRLREDSPYRHGITVFYMREVPSEPAPMETETILYQDDEILAADKPHGMTVTPSGDHVARSLLNRLQERTGIDTLVPLHRLDRDTAGIVLFGLKAGSRSRYHELFAKRTIEREYIAAAAVPHLPSQTHWFVESRLGAGTPWFRREIISGPVNSITEINLLETRQGVGFFHLKPRTGKKHQLRVHMASIGFPILGDPLYPEMRLAQPSDPPLQLLARRIAFTDPLTGMQREFKSARQLGNSQL